MPSLAGHFMDRVVERKVRQYIAVYCQRMPVDDFCYAAENNLDILLDLLKRVFLKPGEEKTARKKAAPYQPIVEKLATPETLIRITTAVAPEHAKVLRQHPGWVSRQLRAAIYQVFGS